MEMNQTTYWDLAASKKEFTTPFQMSCFKRSVPENAYILDVGCGYGRVQNELWQEGYRHSCGIDFSPKMIESGKQRYPHLDLRETTAVFEFENNTFDAVVLVAVLTCIIEDKAQSALIREIMRVLKPGGILYMNDFLINTDERNIKRYKAFEEKYKTWGVFELGEGALLRHHTEDHLSVLSASFECLEYEKLVYTTMNKHSSNGFYYLGRIKKDIFNSP
jgi:ubiquinone/menaquinone biosynthesis C-methylase UbiE